MRKYIIFFIITLVIVCGTSIWIGYNLGLNANKETKNETHSDNNKIEEGQPKEITIDNWKDYIELEDVEETFKDDFGDITGTGKYTILKYKKNVIKSDRVMLKLRLNDEISNNVKVNEQIINVYDGIDEWKTNYKLNAKNKNGSDYKNFDCRATIDDFEVINAKGTVYVK